MAKAKRKARRQFAIEPLDLPTPEQLKSAPYVRDFVTHAESNTKATAHRCYRDPILRWEKDGKITDMQASTIRRMQGLWQIVYGTQKLIGTYGEQLARSTGDSGSEHKLALAGDLRRIEGYFAGLGAWYAIFEKVCRFGLTGPQACETNEVAERQARDKALVVVCFVADFIAAKERW
jgi:hypothetical protein